MDIVSHALLGAGLSQAAFTRKLGRSAALVGIAAALLPDSDAVLSRFSDPALPWDLHRHFTHSLLFVPIGALIAASLFLIFKKWRQRAGITIAAAMLAYLSHVLLDSATSFGTHLFWPFTDQRIAWDVISIIDPMFTIPLLLFVAAAAIWKSPRIAGIGLAIAMSYLSLASVHHLRAKHVQHQLAAARGHTIERGRVMPTFGNIVLWRSVYEHDGVLYADGVRTPFLAPALARAGQSAPRFDQTRDLGDAPASLDPQRLRRVLARFQLFADHYVVLRELEGERERSYLIGDVRYSLSPESFDPLWSLLIQSHSGIDAIQFVGPNVDRKKALLELWRELQQPHESYVAPTIAGLRDL